ncbi:MAG: hypothetical protein JNJ54_08925, partial [Myxococcaceae bacterium]|nr:hypothetical protein [Myxococcaceae bacterium]
KLEGASLVKPSWRSLMISSKGREGLLGSIQKKKKFSFIGGGVAAVLSVPLMIFGPSVESSGPSDPNHSFGGFCNSSLTGAVAKCSANVSTAEGETFTWTVTRKDTWDLTASPAVGKKIQLDPNLVIENAAGEVLLDEASEIGKAVKASLELEPGTYTVRVKDVGGYTVKGGLSFDLEIAEQHPEPKVEAVAAKDEPAAEPAVKPSKKDALKAKLAALKAKKAAKEPVEVAEPAQPVVPAALEPIAAPVIDPVAEIDLTKVAVAEPVKAEPVEPVKPEPAQERAEAELEITAKNLSALAVEMNETCAKDHCKGGFSYIFTNLSCDKTARWCQLDLTAMERASHQAFVATLPFTPAAKTRSAFDEATAQALEAFEAEPKSGRLTPVVVQAKKAPKQVVAKKAVLVEPLASKKAEKVSTRAVAAAPKAQPVVAEPAPVKAAPVRAAAPSPAAPMRANKNMAD